MPTTTTTYSFNKPVVGADEDDWGGYLNGNWDSVDDLLDGTTPVTGIDINSGTLDGVTIGGTTAGAGTFTTLTANTSITGTLATAAQPNITSVGSLTSLDVAGTLTSDGLTVDGLATISNASPALKLDETDTVDKNTYLNTGGGTFNIQTVDDAGTGFTKRLSVSHGTGDISFYEDTGTTAKFFWDASAESLGIGTSSPTAELSVGSQTGSDIDPEVHISGTGAGTKRPALRFYSGTNELGRVRGDSGTGLALSANSRPITFSVDSDSSEAMRIDSSGRVGIGTSSPTSKLVVEGTFAVGNGVSGSINYTSGGGLTLGSTSSDPLVLRTNSTERMRIDSSGWVGIGTTSPLYTLMSILALHKPQCV